MFQYNHLISRNFTNIAIENNRGWRQCTVSRFMSPLLLAQLHREWKCDNVLFAVPPHLTAYTSFLCYSWEVHQAVLTLADFILL